MKKMWTRAALLAAVGCAGLASGPMAGPARAQAMSIGVLDEDRLASSYARYGQALIDLDKQAQEMDAKLQARELLGVLDANASARFDALVLKESRTPAEAAELETLVKKGTSLRAEMLGLTGKIDRSDADNKRLEQLSGASQTSSSAVQGLSDKLFESYKARQNKIDDDNTDKANKVIEQVAADRKLALVWRKRAVIWNAASVDITDEVLARLNKR